MPSKTLYFVISLLLFSHLFGKTPHDNYAAVDGILGQAAASAANLKGTDRAYALWLISRAYGKFNAKKEKESLARSCEVSVLAPNEDQWNSLRQKIQADCLQRLRQVWPSRAAELLSHADPEVRQKISGEDAVIAAKKGNIDDALMLLSSDVGQGASYPYARAISAINAIPEDDRPDRDRIFAQALSIYKQRNDRYAVGIEDLGTMIVRFYRTLSPGLVLAAIDELLDSARDEYVSDNHMEIKVQSKLGSVSFASLYQYRIFQLMPALQELAPAHAETLAQETPFLEQTLKEHAGGLQSLSNSYSQDSEQDPSLAFSFIIKDGPYSDGGAPASDAINLRIQADKILEKAQADPENALQDVAGFPDTLESGRSIKADLLLSIAGLFAKDHENVSLAALQQLQKQIEAYKPILQCRYLVQISAQYLRMNKRDHAMTAIHQGFHLVQTLYEIDVNSDDPNRALKSSWPSTTVSRAFVVLAYKLSPKFAEKELMQITDPDLRVFDEIQIASNLVKTPSYPAILEQYNKHTNSTDVFPIPSVEN